MLLLSRAALDERRRLAAPGGPLAPLAESLAADLAPALARPVWLPPEKARLSRAGGRCPRDGTLLGFDPFAPRRHACPRCGGVYDDEAHYRWWVMGYQLWLAERAVHAAALYALRGDPAHARFAAAVLDAYADAYLGYPNADNVLGPSRPFFSTYLESLWLLHVCVALDLVRAARAQGVRGLSARVRERVVAPSRALVASYDEGASNRQVWNTAAYLAASSLLGRTRDMTAPRGRRTHDLWAARRRAERTLLGDGTWYEGDNYHQFAHRGLWYVLRLGAGRGWDPGPELARRFALGFAAPFRAAFPDLTLPARRDAQYGVSLRQWRWAEWCELGLAWPGADDATRATLGGALATLYDHEGAPGGDTGRWRATGESERNEPPVRLTRADLGWKALLFAEPVPALAEARPPGSVLLADQGLAVFRRDAGRLWAGFDFGTTGGAHGHPDRLNLLLADGAARWLDDMGTGSYVERTLHWYRSTLAHQAPLADGRSQARVPGRLVAYAEHAARDGGAYGWADAEAEIAPGVRVRRAVVVGPDYLVDLVAWNADRPVALDVPVHVDPAITGPAPWTPADPRGAGGLEDGFDFVREVERAPVAPGVVTRLSARDGAHRLDGWVRADAVAAWYRGVAPGPPGAGERRFVWLRGTGRTGWVTAVWSPRGAVREAAVAGSTDARPRIVVRLASGREDHHGRDGAAWRVERCARGLALETVRLGDVRPPGPAAPAQSPDARDATIARGNRRDPLALPFVRRLGRRAYRATEVPWADAGRPRATVRVARAGADLVVDARIRLGRAPAFAPAGAENPMDNERADVNSDGAQLHLCPPGADEAEGWLLVPEPGGEAVRVTPLSPAVAHRALLARWTSRSDGWALQVRVPRVLDAPPGTRPELGLDLLVNEMPPGRERRRGQLVLGGLAAAGERAYVVGDRHDAERLVRVAW